MGARSAPRAFPGQAVPEHDPASHLELVRNADAFLVAPASANTLAKLAHGLADNLLTSAALAATCPVIVAPAMNHAMWEHPATRANLATLRDRGVAVVAPGVGALATKHEWGWAAWPSRPSCWPRSRRSCPTGARPWDGLHVLVTAGGTREPIDSVRFVGNRSSGRMGFALADEAAALGADVTVVAANVGVPPHPARALRRRRHRGGVAGRRRGRLRHGRRAAHGGRRGRLPPARGRAEKLKKAGRDALRRTLEPTVDVLAAPAARRRPDQTVVGFAAEHGTARAGVRSRARSWRGRSWTRSCQRHRRTGIGFDAADNEVTSSPPMASATYPGPPRREVARAILAAVRAARGRGGGAPR